MGVGFLTVCTCWTYATGDPEMGWHTIAGGGAMWSAGGDFELSGTIAPVDAGFALTGGDFELAGGFWAGVPACPCLADVNNDGERNGLDIQAFVDCLLGGGVNCACADVAPNSQVDLDDIAVLVDDLLTGEACP
jgi:hypothetical protein